MRNNKMTTTEQTRDYLESRLGMVDALLKFDSDGKYCIDVEYLAFFMTHYANMKQCDKNLEIAKIDGNFEGIFTHLLNYELGDAPKRIIEQSIHDINSKYQPIETLKQEIKELEDGKE